MKKVILILVMFGLGFIGCKKETNSNLDSTQTESNPKETSKSMKNTISIVEIPVSNMDRAIKFYQTILNVSIEKMAMEDTELGVIPADENSVSVVLVKGKDYTPTKNGIMVYLNLGDDLQPALDKVEKNGGKIVLPKTLISPEMGYYAFIIDTEGTKIGFHSAK
ncbi:VOC family protein [Leptospira congkakensis]|uniref:VOC family protein n=1 Tax=Leptospira congkakensis TaxID=2484932 RepID=A0A4Z1AI54_9LEPT|nr:VOC family protein [Leptospira congkakensis]TGL90779.1 VOC family protein [Leptospira congkakensis]TGL91786.1 VOC family protein [Leptospira congkakensis]TGL98838.1 VOC family protein [Leptospira congkakensis]